MSQTRRGPDPQVSPATERDDNFPERIAEAVVRAGGVARLARLTGSSESVIRKWRLGHSEPTRRNLVRVADAAGVSVQWLAAGLPAAMGSAAKSSAAPRAAHPGGPATIWWHADIDRCLDEIRIVLAWSEAAGVSAHGGSDASLHAQVDAYLRQTARSATVPVATRVRACLLGAVHLADPGLARLYRMLEPHLRSALPDADDATMEIVDSLLAEAGTDPLPGVREGLHRAMVEHGLTRDGAREFLRCLQSGLDAR